MSDTRTDFHFDKNTGGFTLNNRQDCTKIINKNKALYNNVSTKGRKFKENWHMVADVPEILVEKWMKDHKFNFFGKGERDTRIRNRLLNDRDNQFVRTMPGVI